MANPTPVPSNVPRQPNITSTGASIPALPVPSNGGVRIKAEPASSYNAQGLAPGIPTYGNTAARQRAAQHLQNKFGSSANLQVNQLQAQAAMAGVVPPSQPQPSLPNIQLPAHYSEQQRKEFQDQKRQIQQHQYQSLQQAQQRPSIKGSQLDGADEWTTMVAQRRAEAILHTSAKFEVDQTLREQVDQMSLAMEGGGLMMPLSEQPQHSQEGTRKAGQHMVAASSSSSLGRILPFPQSVIAQYDGLKESDDEHIKGDPDLDDDEDAINSDLDDPEENIVEDEGDEEGKQGQIMLCTYDKVQRVKNKWKCTLKDGVLTTGGKE
jgi:transcription initiation factor TFIIA large subunit